METLGTTTVTPSWNTLFDTQAAPFWMQQWLKAPSSIVALFYRMATIYGYNPEGFVLKILEWARTSAGPQLELLALQTVYMDLTQLAKATGAALSTTLHQDFENFLTKNSPLPMLLQLFFLQFVPLLEQKRAEQNQRKDNKEDEGRFQTLMQAWKRQLEPWHSETPVEQEVAMSADPLELSLAEFLLSSPAAQSSSSGPSPSSSGSYG